MRINRNLINYSWCNFLFVALFFSLLISCKKSINQNYSKDENNIYFKLISFGDSIKSPTLEKYLLLDSEIKTQADSLIYNSRHITKNGQILALNSNLINQYFKDYFLKANIEDSMSFYIPPKIFFRTFFDTIPPKFCKNDSIIKYNFKIKAILSVSDYEKLQRAEAEDKELFELKSIDDYLKNKYPNVNPDPNGIYVLEHTVTNGEKPVFGSRTIIKFQGFFLDGQTVDAAPQSMEYVLGTPDQIIKGLNIVISNLKKGEFSKIIVPSRLAFGELGSSNQIVQAYTPLVYEITLIDIK